MKSIHARIKDMLTDRDGYGCNAVHNGVRCSSNITLEVDHIIPIRTQDKRERARDLRHPNLDNMQLLCYVCHRQKSIKDNAG